MFSPLEIRNRNVATIEERAEAREERLMALIEGANRRADEDRAAAREERRRAAARDHLFLRILDRQQQMAENQVIFARHAVDVERGESHGRRKQWPIDSVRVNEFVRVNEQE